MLKKLLLVIMTGLLLNLAIAPSVLASDGAESAAEFAKKVKAETARLGTGPEAKVSVTLKDGKKIKGYISQVDEDDFTVKSGEKDAGSTVAYTAVKSVNGKRSVGGIPRLLIVLGIAIAVTVIVVAISFKGGTDR